jgi:hypothetical protein
MDAAIIEREPLLLMYYEEREHFEHDEAMRRVAHFTGQSVEIIQTVIDEETV